MPRFATPAEAVQAAPPGPACCCWPTAIRTDRPASTPAVFDGGGPEEAAALRRVSRRAARPDAWAAAAFAGRAGGGGVRFLRPGVEAAAHPGHQRHDVICRSTRRQALSGGGPGGRLRYGRVRAAENDLAAAVRASRQRAGGHHQAQPLPHRPLCAARRLARPCGLPSFAGCVPASRPSRCSGRRLVRPSLRPRRAAAAGLREAGRRRGAEWFIKSKLLLHPSRLDRSRPGAAAYWYAAGMAAHAAARRPGRRRLAGHPGSAAVGHPARRQPDAERVAARRLPRRVGHGAGLRRQGPRRPAKDGHCRAICSNFWYFTSDAAQERARRPASTAPTG